MRLQHLLDQIDAVEVADLQQDDRQIARDAEAPQPGLPQPVAPGRGSPDQVRSTELGRQRPRRRGCALVQGEIGRGALANSAEVAQNCAPRDTATKASTIRLATPRSKHDVASGYLVAISNVVVEVTTVRRR
ncbi:MAG: hypothetical protein R6W97_13025, partial [Thiobacillus sp.]